MCVCARGGGVGGVEIPRAGSENAPFARCVCGGGRTIAPAPNIYIGRDTSIYTSSNTHLPLANHSINVLVALRELVSRRNRSLLCNHKA